MLGADSKSIGTKVTNSSRIIKGLLKASKFVFLGFAIGLFDAFQAKYLRVWMFGKDVSITYQILLMIAAALGAYYSLRDPSWSRFRNFLSAAIMTVPHSTLADNVSWDAQTLKPYAVILPKRAFMWRLHVFNRTPLHPVAGWVDTQTLAPGLINGYSAAIVLTIVFIVLQLLWGRLSSKLVF
jgi:hypothetical protein